jgi:hypothetical protein
MQPTWSFVVTMLIVVPAAPAQPRSSGATHVAGEVIVKLKEDHGGTIHALSHTPASAQSLPPSSSGAGDAAAARRHQASLARLRTRYGVEGGTPIEDRP